METTFHKEERIEIRISAKDKIIFKRAQKLSGDKTFSSFITRILRNYSDQIISEKERILATERDRQIFFDAVFGNLEPNENLIAASERYKSKID